MLCPHLHPQKHPRPVVGSEGSISTMKPALQPILSRPDIYLAHFQEFSTIRFQLKFPPWKDTSLTTHIYHHISSYIIIYHHISSYIIIYHHISSYIIIYHHISSYIIIYHHISSYIIIYLQYYNVILYIDYYHHYYLLLCIIYHS